MRRPLRGSRVTSFYALDGETEPTVPPSLSSLDSAFQLQEYISALVRLDPHDVERIVKIPGRSGNGEDKEKEGEVEDERAQVDEACWIYEQLRRLAQDLTHPLITTLQHECTRQSCPEMKAGEWLYLCVAHGNSGAMEHCCAIDYIVHTLDSATALLNSPRAFPSRISIPPTSHRHFPSLARRLGRIFAHAYHHHRLAFESAEAESALYARFLALSRRFELVPAEFLVIPPERRTAGSDEDTARGDVDDMIRKNVTLLTRVHEDVAAAPVPTSTKSSSPRIGGRARTDTMYLSSGYISPADSGSPRRAPSPLAATLARDVGHEEMPLASERNDVKEPVIVPDTKQPLAKDEEKVDRMDEAVLLREPAKVFARDFALLVSVPAAAVDEVHANVDAPRASGEEVSCDSTAGGIDGAEAQAEDVPTVANSESDPDTSPSVPIGDITALAVPHEPTEPTAVTADSIIPPRDPDPVAEPLQTTSVPDAPLATSEAQPETTPEISSPQSTVDVDGVAGDSDRTPEEPEGNTGKAKAMDESTSGDVAAEVEEITRDDADAIQGVVVAKTEMETVEPFLLGATQEGEDGMAKEPVEQEVETQEEKSIAATEKEKEGA